MGWEAPIDHGNTEEASTHFSAHSSTTGPPPAPHAQQTRCWLRRWRSRDRFLDSTMESAVDFLITIEYIVQARNNCSL